MIFGLQREEIGCEIVAEDRFHDKPELLWRYKDTGWRGGGNARAC